MAKKTRAHAQADFAHFPHDSAAVSCSAAHAAVFFGDKKELQTDFRGQHFPDTFFRENFLFIIFQNFLFCQKPFSELPDGVRDHLPGFIIQSSEFDSFRYLKA